MLRPPAASGPYGRDFEAYYAAGRVWDEGGDPWSRDVWRTERGIPAVDGAHDEVLPYVGPAAALPLFGALARLPWPLAERVWSGLLALALCALVLAALALAGIETVVALLAGFTFALASGAAISALALGQAALVAAGALATALARLRVRDVTGATLATLVAGLQPNLVPALVARLRDRTAWIAAVAAAALFATATLACGGGVRGLAAYVALLRAHGGAERFVTIQHTPAGVAWSFGASPALAVGTGAALALAAVVAVALAPRCRTLVALALLPLAVPFFHEHDFVVALIPGLIVARRAEGPVRVLAGIGAACVFVDWFGAAQRPAAHAQIVAEALAVSLAFVALGRGPRFGRAELVPVVATLALAGVAIPLAARHPAPTWPDALPPGYRAPAHADMSATWADEQRAAGLDARDPAWGALRAIPLAGVALLAFAAARCRRS